MQDKNFLFNKVKFIIKKAGETVLFYYKKDYEINEKGPGSPVTIADIESNKVIIEGLKKFGYGILSEESTDDKSRLKQRRVWIIDPMDGTSDFIDKTGEFTIMIGLVEDEKPIMGLVYKPVDDILYYGIKGMGAYKLESGKVKKLKVSNKKNISEVVMLSSRFHRSEAEVDFAGKYSIKKFIARGSSLKICQIAEGAGDLNFNPSDKTWEWDVCAADIILSEAGGKLTDTRGQEFRYNKEDPRNINGYVASNGILHEKVIKHLAN